MKVKVWVETRQPRSRCERTVEIEDIPSEGLSTSDWHAEIEDAVRDRVWGMLFWNWEIVG